MASATPRLRVEAACQELGGTEVVERCLHLLAGGCADPDFLITLGGPAAMHLLDHGAPDQQAYWLRVWAARGLLWAGPGGDIGLLRTGLNDDAWRVREMLCKVVARYRVGDLLDDVAGLESDPVQRVRAAAGRAVISIVQASA